MAYQIDFTASNYVNRFRRKVFLRLLLLAAVAGAVYGVYYVYKTYNEPTLNMKLAEYEAVARPIEEMNKVWDEAVKEYNAILRYYRLLWAANPTNYLCAMVSTNAPSFGPGFHRLDWALKTGGECKLDYIYVFNPGDKAEQARAIETNIVNAVTSVVNVVDGKVEVQGVKTENLLNVNDLRISVRFSLPDVKTFPQKERVLAERVNEIANLRKKVQETQFMKVADAKGDPTTALALMTKPYIEIGKEAKGLPDHRDAIDIMGWLRHADKFIEGAVANTEKTVPDSDVKRRQHLKDVWNRIGEARFPWHRFRVLDNYDLVNSAKEMGEVSDGVRRFKGFLDQRHADCIKKLEPFIEAYDHDDVFNEPFIESDLTNRVAKAAGISRARVMFKDELGVEPAVLVKADEKFTFTWVRWTLVLGSGADQEGGKRNGGDHDAIRQEPLTLEKLVDCTLRVLDLGPGYALDSVRVRFGEGEIVNGAILEGLLPVKKVEDVKKKESTKEADGNGH